MTASDEGNGSFNKGNLIMMIVILPAVLFGVYLCIISYAEVREGWNSGDWPQAKGVVLSSGVKHHEHSRKTTGINFRYSADVQYSYSVNGETYSNRRLAVAEEKWDFAREAKMAASSYPKGAEVVVYYRPDDPQQSMLQPGVRFSSLSGILIGAGLVIVFGLFEVLLFKGMFLKMTPRRE